LTFPKLLTNKLTESKVHSPSLGTNNSQESNEVSPHLSKINFNKNICFIFMGPCAE